MRRFKDAFASIYLQVMVGTREQTINPVGQTAESRYKHQPCHQVRQTFAAEGPSRLASADVACGSQSAPTAQRVASHCRQAIAVATDQIRSAHVCTPVNNEQYVSALL